MNHVVILMAGMFSVVICIGYYFVSAVIYACVVSDEQNDAVDTLLAVFLYDDKSHMSDMSLYTIEQVLDLNRETSEYYGAKASLTVVVVPFSMNVTAGLSDALHGKVAPFLAHYSSHLFQEYPGIGSETSMAKHKILWFINSHAFPGMLCGERTTSVIQMLNGTENTQAYMHR